MDSKVVDKALRATLWPALERAGFERRTGRTAWRDQGAAVGCVNVQSFNRYLADGLGATTYSFALNLGPNAPREMYGGTIGSPLRWHAICALAAATGDRRLLQRAIDTMSAQDFYRDRPADLDRLRQDLA